MEDFVDGEMTFTNHETFFAIAWRSHESVERLVKERERRPARNRDDVDFHCATNAEIQRAAMISVVFSALTLECQRALKTVSERALQNQHVTQRCSPGKMPSERRAMKPWRTIRVWL